MRCEEIVKTLEVIKKSGELVFEHYKARGFKNTLIEVGIKNIIGICDTALEQIEREKGQDRTTVRSLVKSFDRHRMSVASLELRLKRKVDDAWNSFTLSIISNSKKK
jgi:hypothetical protein